MNPDRRWTLPLLLIAALVLMGQAAAGCTDNGDSNQQGGDGQGSGGSGSGGPELTLSQEQALYQAQSLIDTDDDGFSPLMLITDLRYVAGFTKAEATFATDNVRVDWKEEAVDRAQSRLDSSDYSRQSLLKHLTKVEGFTNAEAVFAADTVCGLESAACWRQRAG